MIGILQGGSGMPATGSLPIIIYFAFNYSVWSFWQTGRATRYGAVWSSYQVLSSVQTNALLHFALAGPSPHCPRRGEITMTINRIARIALFASLAVLLSAFLASSGGPSRRQGPASSRSIRRLHSRRWHRHHQFRRRRSQHYVRPGDGRFAWRRGCRFTCAPAARPPMVPSCF